MEIRLRPTIVSDELAFRAAHESMSVSDNWAFGLNFDPGEPFERFVERHRDFAVGRNLAEGFVPATFLVAVLDGDIVGRVSVRHQLNDFLRAEAGHIGYGVLRDYRGKGVATEMLRQSLVVARSLGIDRALLVCDEDNPASAKVIERCAGELVSTGVAEDGAPIRRYEIQL